VVPFRRALSKEDQEASDKMLACAKQQLQAEMQLAGLRRVARFFVLEGSGRGVPVAHTRHAQCRDTLYYKV
jgi:hypothetical protein